MRVSAGSAALRKTPDGAAEQVNQILFGEPVRLYLRDGEWAYVQLGLDHYVGWVRLASLAPAGGEPTHRVRVLRTFLYERADMKSRPMRAISMNARMALSETSGNFVEVDGGGWVFARHVSPLEETETDFVAVAQRFVGSPYLWGGRECGDRLFGAGAGGAASDRHISAAGFRHAGRYARAGHLSRRRSR